MMLKTKKSRFAGLPILLMCFFVFSCSLSAASGESALTKEADKLAREYWDSGFSKCDDYYYGRSITRVGLRIMDALYQYKDLNIETKPGKLSEADKLNGIEWKGTSYLNPKVYREYLYDLKKWGKWNNGEPSGPPVYVNLIKRRGEWSVGKDILEQARYKKIDCKDIPD